VRSNGFPGAGAAVKVAPLASVTPRREAFVATTPYEPTHPKALAIYCSDGRFTDAVEDLGRHLGHARLDTLTMPGGPGLLDTLHARLTDLEAITRSATFLIRGHAIEHAVLVAHAGCGYYRQRFGTQGADVIEGIQHAHLRLAGRALAGAHAGLDVHLFFARPSDGRVRFEPLGPVT
jgi:hypothetical protein